MVVLLLCGLKWILQRVFHLTPLPQLLRVCSRVARFIYWLLLNHFFLPVHAGVSLLHTIKSVVFLLDLLDGVCGKRYIKSASIEQCFRALPNNHESVTPMGFHIAMLLCLLHASLSHTAVARKETTAGDWVIDSPTTCLPQSLLVGCRHT